MSKSKYHAPTLHEFQEDAEPQRRQLPLYTPGPWEVAERGVGADHAYYIEPAICRVSGLGRIPAANAALIAAAPALLEAAQRFLACIENITTDEFSKGGERLEREALRLAIKNAGVQS